MPDLSNKFHWSTYEVPRVPANAEEEEAEQESFTIRSLKQGGTGAYKTWPAAELLLEYLARQGGLNASNDSQKAADNPGVLDLTDTALYSPEFPFNDKDNGKPFNVVELGGGTGYLSVGLALSLNREACNQQIQSSSGRFQPKVRLMCTDMDKGTIKNMRYNVTQQARDRNVTKAVHVETLSWGEALGGEAFSKAVQAHFGNKPPQSTESNHSDGQDRDPIRLVTHLIGSDVHYGQATLEPLSSVVSGFKLRNPEVSVVLAIKERTPNAMEDLKQQIEQKVKCAALSNHPDLEGFSVRVRDVIHNYGENLSNLKMVEC